MGQLQHIQPLYGPNLGGLVGCVRLIPASNLVVPPLVLDGQVVGLLSLVQEDNFCDVWFTPGTGQLLEEADTVEQGRLYKQKLSLEVPRNAPDVGQTMEQILQLRDFVALCRDHNGCTYLVGSPDWPLRATTGLDTSRRIGEGNRRSLQLTVDSPVPAAFYQQFAAQAGSRRVFSTGFSFGFQRTR